MKLYATTTSERATKGQGGKHIDIQLQGEGGQELGVISARYDEYNKEYFLNYWHKSKCISINRIKEVKGKSQKGECKICKFTNNIDLDKNGVCGVCRK
jgi:hypothetical protein